MCSWRRTRPQRPSRPGTQGRPTLDVLARSSHRGPAPKPAPITIVTATDFADVRDRPGRRITLPAEQNDHWRRIRRTMLLTRT